MTFSAALSTPRGVHLFNIVQKSEADRERYIEFYVGDIADLHGDLLLVSAFEGGLVPIQGTVLGALRVRFGVDLRNARLTPTSAAPNVHVCSSNLSNFPFRKLAVVYMSSLHGRQATAGELRGWIRGIAKALPELLSPENTSVALPLLGTGHQGLPPNQIAEILLAEFDVWIHACPSLQIIRVAVYDHASIAAVSNAINRVLHRPSTEDALIRAACQEFRATLSRTGGELKSKGERIAVLAENEAKHWEVVEASRHFAETAVSELHAMAKISPISNLHQSIEALQPFLNTRAPWISQYLQLLRGVGNMGHHQRWHSFVNRTDAVAALIAAERISGFLISLTPENKLGRV